MPDKLTERVKEILEREQKATLNVPVISATPPQPSAMPPWGRLRCCERHFNLLPTTSGEPSRQC